jgi:hypothetical protein
MVKSPVQMVLAVREAIFEEFCVSQDYCVQRPITQIQTTI